MLCPRILHALAVGVCQMIRLDDPDKARIMAGMLSVLKEAVPIEPIEGIKVKLRTDKK